MKRIFLPLVAAFALMMTACGDSTATVVVDPGYNDLTVTIDGEAVETDYGYGTTMDLATGSHTVLAIDEDGATFFEGDVDVSGDGIINLTGQRYILWTDVYSDNYTLYSMHLDIAEYDLMDVEYDETVVVEADLTFFEGDFIDGDWDYDLETEWADEVDMYGDYELMSKIYREEDFVYEAYDWGLVIDEY